MAALAAAWQACGYALPLAEAAGAVWRKQAALQWHAQHGKQAAEERQQHIPALLAALADTEGLARTEQQLPVGAPLPVAAAAEQAPPPAAAAAAAAVVPAHLPAAAEFAQPPARPIDEQPPAAAGQQVEPPAAAAAAASRRRGSLPEASTPLPSSSLRKVTPGHDAREAPAPRQQEEGRQQRREQHQRREQPQRDPGRPSERGDSSARPVHPAGAAQPPPEPGPPAVPNHRRVVLPGVPAGDLPAAQAALADAISRVVPASERDAAAKRAALSALLRLGLLPYGVQASSYRQLRVSASDVQEAMREVRCVQGRHLQYQCVASQGSASI